MATSDRESMMQPKLPDEKVKQVVTTPEAGQVALKIFFTLTTGWGCSSKQQRVLLGFISITTLYRYRRLPKTRLPLSAIERISHLMSIHKNLGTIFGKDSDRVYNWISSPNTAPSFDGQTALQYMLSGRIDEIVCVRRYLDCLTYIE
jgi:hypothetical protein